MGFNCRPSFFMIVILFLKSYFLLSFFLGVIFFLVFFLDGNSIFFLFFLSKAFQVQPHLIYKEVISVQTKLAFYSGSAQNCSGFNYRPLSEVGIYKGKQESKNKRKHAFDQESEKKRKR